MPPEEPMDRRRFFRFGLRGLLKPLAETIDAVADVAETAAKIDVGAVDKKPPTGSVNQPAPTVRPPDGEPVTRGRSSRAVPMPPSAVLRPPGALDEKSFITTCDRSGECVTACPAQCIHINPAKAGGAPFIEIDHMPCVVCDGLYCMHACPSGALVPTPLGDIDMGTAVWKESTCRRTHGEDCSICVDECPIGNVAIELDPAGKVRVIEDGCIGCGVCQNRCPTQPKSIVVIPSRNPPS